MEFFEFVDVTTNQEDIRTRVLIDTLPHFCKAVEAVDGTEELGRVVYFREWGRFHIRQETVMGGVRFSVPDCPNALAWTVTTGYPPCPQKIVLHASINRIEHNAEFIAATQTLLASLKIGLEENFTGNGKASAATRPLRIPCL